MATFHGVKARAWSLDIPRERYFHGLSRNPLLNLRSLYELQTKMGSFFREHLDLLVAVFLFVELGALIQLSQPLAARSERLPRFHPLDAAKSF